MKDNVSVFVYGSCRFTQQTNKSAVGNGAYGVVLRINDENAIEIAAGYSATTNARMDLLGIIEGLQRIDRPANVKVFLSNMYIIDAISKGWLEKWKHNYYKGIKHNDLWKRLENIIVASPIAIEFLHSKGLENSPDYKHASELSQAMSLRKDLPPDLMTTSRADDLFASNLQGESGGRIISSAGPHQDSICVDASAIQNPGPMEFRGVETKSRKVIFERKYKQASNNIGEFLAIVYALALYQKQGKELNIIYSDSHTAIKWVNQKQCKTKLTPTAENAEVFDHIRRALQWLENHQYNTKILKWNTAEWGQIPADYGRK